MLRQFNTTKGCYICIKGAIVILTVGRTVVSLTTGRVAIANLNLAVASREIITRKVRTRLVGRQSSVRLSPGPISLGTMCHRHTIITNVYPSAVLNKFKKYFQSLISLNKTGFPIVW